MEENYSKFLGNKQGRTEIVEVEVLGETLYVKTYNENDRDGEIEDYKITKREGKYYSLAPESETPNVVLDMVNSLNE